MKYKFRIQGLDCANCASELERKIGKIDEIEEVSINFILERLTVECDEQNKEDVIEKIKKVVKKQEPDVTIKEI